MSDATTGTRSIGVAHALLAVLLLCRPRRVATRIAGPSGTPPPSWLVRVLGVRVAAQAGLELGRPTPDALAASALVDGLHAASMLPLLIGRRYRRAALLSGGLATVSAAVLLAVRESTR